MLPTYFTTDCIVMNTISHGAGNSNVDDSLDFEHVQSTARNDEVKPSHHRKPIRLWVVVGVGALIVVILWAILIPAMFLDHNSVKAGVEQETDVKQVCVLYWWCILALYTVSLRIL
jgi:hypothetical protein